MKKVLVISFDCFNLSGSNGRSLGSILELLNDEISVSQIYIKDGKPNFIKGDYCFIQENKLIKNFFSVKKSSTFFNFDPASCIETDDKNSSKVSGTKKTPFKMMCRNLVWSFASPRMKPVYEWAKSIQPDYVLIQAGDLPYLHSLAIKIASMFNSKLIYYTSENYPLKKQNYTNLERKSLFYPLVRKKLFRITKKLLSKCESAIFLTESLKEEYEQSFSLPLNRYVIYPCSQIEPMAAKTKDGSLIFSYCGNLGLGRYKTIIEAAKILKHKYPNSKIIVCGNADNTCKEQFKQEANISYLGVVSYENVIQIYNQSDFLLHTECFDNKIANDSVHAFSGKIADCISSCRPFIFIGPKNMFEYRFLEATHSGIVFDSIQAFSEKVDSGYLDTIVVDPKHQIEIRDKYFSKTKTKELLGGVFDL